MNATHIFKSVAVTTALGVFLTGCGGGPDTNHAPSRTTTPVTNATPIVSPVTSGGSGTIGGNDTGTIDSVATAVNALNTKMDQTLAEASSANKHSKSTDSKSTALLVLASIFGAFMIAKNVNIGMKVSKATGSKNKGLKAGLLGDTSELQKADIQASEGRLNDEIGDVRARTEANGKATAVIGGATIKTAAVAAARAEDANKKIDRLEQKMDESTLSQEQLKKDVAAQSKEIEKMIASIELKDKSFLAQYKADLDTLSKSLERKASAEELALAREKLNTISVEINEIAATTSRTHQQVVLGAGIEIRRPAAPSENKSGQADKAVDHFHKMDGRPEAEVSTR